MSFTGGEASAAPEVVNPSAVYSNVTTFTGAGIANGGAATDPAAPANTITRLLADDLTLLNAAGSPPYTITGFVFTVANFSGVTITARPRVVFYLANGPGGGPGTSLGGFAFDQTAIPSGANLFQVTGLTGPNVITSSSRFMWVGITFDNNNGTNSATAAQLNQLGVGLYNPVNIGSSADLAFITATNGGFNSNNPPGTTFNTPGVVDNFGIELRVAATPTAGGVTVSGRVLSSDGRGITGTRVTLTDPEGVSVSVATDRRGGFNFADVTAGRTYIVTVQSRRFTFDQPSQVITITDQVTGLDFTASPTLAR